MSAEPGARSVAFADGRAWEFAIVGGGLAGSALAARLARSGRRVLLLERERFPRDKVCGEFLSTESARLLEELGCLDDVRRAGAVRIGGARISAPGGATLELELPGEGLGLSRRRLDELLFRHAARCGAEAVEGAAVRRLDPAGSASGADGLRGERSRLEVELAGGGTVAVDADCIVGAYGRRSSLDTRAGRPFVRERHPYVGLKRHHRPVVGAAGERLRETLAGVVEVHAFRDGYAGISLVEDGIVNVCALVRERFLAGLPSSRWEVVAGAMAAGNPTLRRRLEALVPAGGPTLAVAGVPLCAKEPAVGDVLFVGDAAGMITPFCGDGQAMALASAALLGGIIEARYASLEGDAPARLAADWSRAWRKRYGRRLTLGRLLQPLLFGPALAGGAIFVLRRVPAVARMLTRWTRGRSVASGTGPSFP